MLYVGIQLIILLEEREQYKEMYKRLHYVPKTDRENLAAHQYHLGRIGQHLNPLNGHIYNADSDVQVLSIIGPPMFSGPSAKVPKGILAIPIRP
jgi:hypothetical protein